MRRHVQHVLLTAAHRRPLSLMQNQAERMRRIIEDLLTLSRLEMSDEVRDA